MQMWLLASTCLAGAVIALAFAAFGAQRLLPQPALISPGARILLVPGAFLLWPYILVRWLGNGMRR